MLEHWWKLIKLRPIYFYADRTFDGLPDTYHGGDSLNTLYNDVFNVVVNEMVENIDLITVTRRSGDNYLLYSLTDQSLKLIEMVRYERLVEVMEDNRDFINHYFENEHIDMEDIDKILKDIQMTANYNSILKRKICLAIMELDEEEKNIKSEELKNKELEEAKKGVE